MNGSFFNLKEYLFILLFCLSAQLVTAQTDQINGLKASLPFIKDSLKYVDTFNKIGFLMHMKNADSCLYYGIKGKAIAMRLNYPKGKAQAMINIGSSLFLNSLYKESLSVFVQALEIYKKENDKPGIVNIFSNLAVVYQVLGDNKKALRFSESSLSEGNQIMSDSMMSMIYANYIYFHPNLRKDSIMLLLEKAKNIATNFRDDRAKVMILQQHASLYLGNNQLEKARILIEESLQISRKKALEYHEIVSLQYYADYYVAKNKPMQAIRCYESALRLASKNEFSTFEKELLEQKKNVHLKHGNNANVAKINSALVLVLEKELKHSRQFLGDYVAYNEKEQDLIKFQLDKKNDQKKLYALIIALVTSLLVIGYTIYLNKRLHLGAKIQKELNLQIAFKNTKLQEETKLRANLIDQLQTSYIELNRQFGLRTHIISAISHDIRTPLQYTHLVSGHLQGLLENTEMQESKQAIRAIVESTARILNLLENMIGYSKVLYDKGKYEKSPTKLRQLLTEKLTLFSALAKQKETKIIMNVKSDLKVVSNVHLLSIVLHNILDNAVKHTRGGEIIISAYHANGETELSVKNSGKGFQKNILKWINTSTEDDQEHEEITSSGLGLLIVRELCQILDISLTAKNENGAVVTLLFSNKKID